MSPGHPPDATTSPLPRPSAERPGDPRGGCPPATTSQRTEEVEEIRAPSLPFCYPSSATNGERSPMRSSRCLVNGCCGTAASANGIRGSASQQRGLYEACQQPRLRAAGAARLSPLLWAGAGGRGQGGAPRRPAVTKKKNQTKPKKNTHHENSDSHRFLTEN